MALRWLSREQVKQCIDMPAAIDATESAFLELAEGKTDLPLRTAIHVDAQDGLVLNMPGFLSGAQILGLKTVSVFPGNAALHKPAINGVILLLDAKTGEPDVLMDATWLTALRTGAVSGVATRYAARDDASRVAIIGSGTQAWTQLEAVAAVRDIQQVSVWSRSPENARAFAKRCEARFEVTVCDTVASAVRDADVVCTTTASTEPLIFAGDLKPDAHINAIGSHAPTMREIDAKVLAQAVVLVDQREAALAEAGEVIDAVAAGKLRKESLIELGAWLRDGQPACKHTLSVFKSVGLAIQDLAVAHAVRQQAVRLGLGTLLQ